MIYLAYALAFASGIAGCVVLMQSGHPWFAAWVLIVTESLKFKVKGKPAQPRTPEDA